MTWRFCIKVLMRDSKLLIGTAKLPAKLKSTIDMASTRMENQFGQKFRPKELKKEMRTLRK